MLLEPACLALCVRRLIRACAAGRPVLTLPVPGNANVSLTGALSCLACCCLGLSSGREAPVFCLLTGSWMHVQS